MTRVASAVRRSPRRSSPARGVTATVSSHSPAANGNRAAESVSMRMMASPPGAQLSAALRIENVVQDWRSRDDERHQQHGERRRDRQAPEAFDVQTKKRCADHESGQGPKNAEPQPNVTHPDPRLRQRPLPTPSAERHRTATRPSA